MPLIIKESSHSGTTTYIWHRIEPDSYFLSEMDIREGKWEEVEQWNKARKAEWICGRYLIQKFLGCTSRELQLDDKGKPHLNDHSQQLSLSHSGSWVGLSHSKLEIGLDIQVYRPGIAKLAHKYIRPDEIELANQFLPLVDTYHYIWCCKEAIYKADGRRELDFKKNISVSDVSLIGNIVEWKGVIVKNTEIKHYKIRSRSIDQCYMAIARLQ